MEAAVSSDRFCGPARTCEGRERQIAPKFPHSRSAPSSISSRLWPAAQRQPGPGDQPNPKLAYPPPLLNILFLLVIGLGTPHTRAGETTRAVPYGRRERAAQRWLRPILVNTAGERSSRSGRKSWWCFFRSATEGGSQKNSAKANRHGSERTGILGPQGLALPVPPQPDHPAPLVLVQHLLQTGGSSPRNGGADGGKPGTHLQQATAPEALQLCGCWGQRETEAPTGGAGTTTAAPWTPRPQPPPPSCDH
nr:uncharacterized protein LOC127311772 isoform X1 [Lolium perenne]